MKTKFKNYWVIIVLVIVANVAIFSFFSHRLESFVVDYTVDLQTKSGL